jgi:hypothetical protein
MSYNIFISADSKDTDLARDLCKRLDGAGLTVTTSAGKIDNPREDKKRIANLKKADEVIFLITNGALEGKKILFDLGCATSLKKRLAAVLVGLRPKELPSIVQGLDFITYDELEGYIDRLRRQVEEASKPSAEAQPKSGGRSKSAA